MSSAERPQSSAVSRIRAKTESKRSAAPVGSGFSTA
jgi:hypothetical protein